MAAFIERRPYFILTLCNVAVAAWWLFLGPAPRTGELSLAVLFFSLAVINLTLLFSKHLVRRRSKSS